MISDKFIAVFELVKNSYDAGAHSVVITFQDLNGTNPQIIISDDGCGMSYDDILGKWLFVAYSAKKEKNYIFNVLWFEDNAGWYRLQKPTLESTVSEHCLRCNITPKRSSAFDIEELKATNYDLILMDYDLASKITGAHVISAIRDANILTDMNKISFPISQYKDHYRRSITSVNGVWQCIEVKCLTDVRAIAVYTAGRTFPLYAAPILWEND